MRLHELHFDLPRANQAAMPREARGQRRDASRLLVIDRGNAQMSHTRFYNIGRYLRPGDLLVINNSATVPAALHGRLGDGSPVEVHLTPPRSGDLAHREAVLDAAVPIRAGERIQFDGGSLEAVVEGRRTDVTALHRLVFRAGDGQSLHEALHTLSKPIIYHDYVEGDWSLDYFQTIFARVPGSSEMPSAARHFTPELLRALHERGIETAELTLHTGVSSVEIEEETVEDHVMYEEEYNLPVETAAIINRAKTEGRRVIAVGTTVTRTLETCANVDGTVTAAHGWTNLYITPGYRFKAIDGLITGLHEARSTRLVLLTAFAGNKKLVLQAYHQALVRGYQWHEWGDATLVL